MNFKHNDPDRQPATGAPSRLVSAETRPWYLQQKSGTGMLLMVRHMLYDGRAAGYHLARVDQASGTIYLWDRRVGCEVAVSVRDLFPNLFGI